MVDINATVQGSFGSLVVNQFTRSGRTKRVFIQGEAASRMQAKDLSTWFVQNKAGQMLPLSSLLRNATLLSA